MSLPQFEHHPFLLSVEDVAKQLEVDIDNGLTEAKAKQLHEQYGDNTLDVGGTTPWYSILFRQFFNAMIIVRALVFSNLPRIKSANARLFRSYSWPLYSHSYSGTGSKAAC